MFLAKEADALKISVISSYFSAYSSPSGVRVLWPTEVEQQLSCWWNVVGIAPHPRTKAHGLLKTGGMAVGSSRLRLGSGNAAKVLLTSLL